MLRLTCLHPMVVWGLAWGILVVPVMAQPFQPKPSHIDSLTHLVATAKADSLKGYWQCLLCESLRQTEAFFDAKTAGEAGFERLEKAGSERKTAECLYYLGKVRADEGDYSQALKYFRQSLRMGEQLKDSARIVSANIGIGYCYMQERQYKSAVTLLRKSAEYLEEHKQTDELAWCCFYLANVYRAGKRPRKAEPFARRSLILAKKNHNLPLMKQSAEILYQVESATGDYRGAFRALLWYKRYTDSLIEVNKQYEDLRIKAKYSQELKNQHQKEVLRQAEKERRNNLQYIFICFVLIGFFAILLFLTKYELPERVMDMAIFACLLMLFEFLIVFFDPILDELTDGIPVWKFLLNMGIVVVYSPLHFYLRMKLRKRTFQTIDPFIHDEADFYPPPTTNSFDTADSPKPDKASSLH